MRKTNFVQMRLIYLVPKCVLHCEGNGFEGKKAGPMKVQNAILGLINIHPDITGYQLKSIIDKSSGNVVRIHLSRIYPALRELTEQGMLSCRNVPRPGRLDEKYYSLTPKGEEKLKEWLMTPFPFTQSRSCFDEYMLELSAMPCMGNERIISYIDEGIVWLQASLEYETTQSEQVDTDFVRGGDSAKADDYVKLWKSQRSLIVQETENRIAWLKELRKTYAHADEGAKAKAE